MNMFRITINIEVTHLRVSKYFFYYNLESSQCILTDILWFLAFIVIVANFLVQFEHYFAKN